MFPIKIFKTKFVSNAIIHRINLGRSGQQNE